MKIITVAHQKGGVGKTTLALNLAHCFAEDAKVGIADTDVQGSISDLKTLIQGVDIIDIESVLKRKTDGYDVVIIDTPPYLTNRLPELFEASDYVLIPTKAGWLDAMAIRATIALLQQSMKKRPGLRAGIVLNMIDTRTSLNDEVKEMLDGYEIPLHKVAITQRVSYARSPVTNGVFNSEDGKAKAEIVGLATEIVEHMNS